MSKMTYVPGNSLQHCYSNKKLETTQTSTNRELIEYIIQRETTQVKKWHKTIHCGNCEDLHC